MSSLSAEPFSAASDLERDFCVKCSDEVDEILRRNSINFELDAGPLVGALLTLFTHKIYWLSQKAEISEEDIHRAIKAIWKRNK